MQLSSVAGSRLHCHCRLANALSTSPSGSSRVRLDHIRTFSDLGKPVSCPLVLLTSAEFVCSKCCYLVGCLPSSVLYFLHFPRPRERMHTSDHFTPIFSCRFVDDCLRGARASFRLVSSVHVIASPLLPSAVRAPVYIALEPCIRHRHYRYHLGRGNAWHISYSLLLNPRYGWPFIFYRLVSSRFELMVLVGFLSTAIRTRIARFG